MNTLSPADVSRAPHASHAWINVASFNAPEDAERFSQWLQAGGINARIQDERALQKVWFLARPMAGVHVRVPEPMFEEAQNYLERNSNADRFLIGAIRCPSCNSLRVQYPQMTRKNILPTMVAQILVLVGVMRRECYCETCHHTWSPPWQST